MDKMRSYVKYNKFTGLNNRNCNEKTVLETATEIFILLKIVWDVTCVIDAQFSAGIPPKSCSSPCNRVAHRSTQPRCFGLDFVSSGANTPAPQQQGVWWHHGLIGGYPTSVELAAYGWRDCNAPFSPLPLLKGAWYLAGSSCSFRWFFSSIFISFQPFLSLHVPPCVLNHKNIFQSHFVF